MPHSTLPFHLLLSVLVVIVLVVVVSVGVVAAVADDAVESSTDADRVVVITVYVSFGTYNDKGLTAWQIMASNAAKAGTGVGDGDGDGDGDNVNYKRALEGMIASVFVETFGTSRRTMEEVVEEEEEEEEEEEAAAMTTTTTTTTTTRKRRRKTTRRRMRKSHLGLAELDETHNNDGTLLLVDSPIVHGLDVPCPNPPGWIPPYPRGAYTCQDFKSALEIEVNPDVVSSMNLLSKPKSLQSSAIEQLDLELSIGAKVEEVYRKSVQDGSMARALWYVEGGGGTLHVLWDDPILSDAWRRYGGDDGQVDHGYNGGGVVVVSGVSIGGGGKEEGRGLNKGAIIGGSMFGVTLVVFILALYVHKRRSDNGFKPKRFDDKNADSSTDSDSTSPSDEGNGEHINGGEDVRMLDETLSRPSWSDDEFDDEAFDLPII